MCTERGVKLATDYSKSPTKDSQEMGKIYQVVEVERRAKPDAKKSTVNKWFFIIFYVFRDDLLKISPLAFYPFIM